MKYKYKNNGTETVLLYLEKPTELHSGKSVESNIRIDPVIGIEIEETSEKKDKIKEVKNDNITRSMD